MAMNAGAVALSKSNAVVFQLNDLQSRRDLPQQNATLSLAIHRLKMQNRYLQPHRSYSGGRRRVNMHVRELDGLRAN